MVVMHACPQSLEAFRQREPDEQQGGGEEDDDEDPITAVTASDKTLVVGRRSGVLHLYGLPSLRCVCGRHQQQPD